MLGFRIGFILIPIVLVLGFSAFFSYRFLSARKNTAFIPKESPFIFEPPKKATRGVLTLATGEVLHRTRQSENFQEASAGGMILQGELLATKKGSAEAKFEKIGTIFAGNNAELATVNLIPEENVFLQKSGSVQYESISTYPLSVRTLHMLSEISGNTTITVLGNAITVRVTKGTTKLAFVDIDNTTKIWTINKNQQATIDDELRRIIVR